MIVYSYNGERGSGKTSILKELYAILQSKWCVPGHVERFDNGKLLVVKDKGRHVGICANCRTVEVVEALFNKAQELGLGILVVEGDREEVADAIKAENGKYKSWQYKSRFKEARKPVLPYSQDKDDVNVIMNDLGL